MEIESMVLDLRGEGAYTIKKVGSQEYLYRISTSKGKQKWEVIGNVKDLDPKDPKLVKAKAVILSKEAKDIIEKYLSGSIDKAKATKEVINLLEGKGA